MLKIYNGQPKRRWKVSLVLQGLESRPYSLFNMYLIKMKEHCYFC